MMGSEQQPNRYSIMNGLIWDNKKQSPNVGHYLPGATVLLNEQDRQITALRAALEAMVSAAENLKWHSVAPVERDVADGYLCGWCGTTFDVPHAPTCGYATAERALSDQLNAARALLDSGKGVRGG